MADFVRSLPYFTETRYTCPANTRDRAGKGGGGGMAGAGGRSGAERHEATCHPRLGGACEAMGLVREGQAGVAGAALARDGKAGAMPPGMQPDQS